MKDRLPYVLVDGFRYRISRFTKISVGAAIKGKEDKTVEPQKGSTGSSKRKLKSVYVVNKRKFHSSGTEEEEKQEIHLYEPDEEKHRIIQFKIR
jgi:hypothetical protein